MRAQVWGEGDSRQVWRWPFSLHLLIGVAADANKLASRRLQAEHMYLLLEVKERTLVKLLVKHS